MITIDIIIATYKRPESLKKTLESILGCQTDSSFQYAVTVVDNNSQDNTKEVVENLALKFNGRLHYIFEPKQGRSFAVNTGIQRTKGDYVALTDDDCLLDSMWLIHMAENIRNKNVDILAGKVIPRFEQMMPNWLDLNYKVFWGPVGQFDLGDDYLDSSQRMIFAAGANCILRRSSIDKFGSFAKEARGQDTNSATAGINKVPR